MTPSERDKRGYMNGFAPGTTKTPSRPRLAKTIQNIYGKDDNFFIGYVEVSTLANGQLDLPDSFEIAGVVYRKV